MNYIIFPLLFCLFIFFVGKAIKYEFNINTGISNFAVGFISFFAAIYFLYFFLIVFKASFNIYVFVTAFLVLAFLFLIIKNKAYKQNKVKKDYIIFFIFFALQIILFYFHTIGNYYASDIYSYAEFISNNIKSNYVNANISGTYIFQSYYVFASVITYIENALSTVLHLSNYRLSAYVWFFNIFNYALKTSLMIDIFSVLKIVDKRIKTMIVAFWLLFYGTLYWNIEQGSLGGSFRMLLCSYMLLLVWEYLKNKKEKPLLCLYALTCWANCSFTSSSIMPVCIFTYVFYVYMIKTNDNILAYALLSISMPFANLIFFFTNNYLFTVCSLLLIIALLLFRKQIYIVYKKCHFGSFTIMGICFFIIFSSFKITNNLLDFSSFTNTLSWVKDYTINYTYTKPIHFLLCNIVVWLLIIVIIAQMLKKDNDISIILVIMMLCFFSPFHSAFWQKIDMVYYRTYDMFINQFSFSLALVYCFKKIKLNSIKTILCIVVVAVSAFITLSFNKMKVDYVLPDNASNFSKYTKCQEETIDFVKYFVHENNIENLKVITTLPEINAEISNVTTLYGRQKIYTDNNEELAKIFYPADYYGDPYAPVVDNYSNIGTVISNSNYDLIIQSKKIMYHSEENDTYYPLSYLINDAGYYPIFENEEYAVYDTRN